MLDLDAGKYALFIWPAYGLTALVFVAMIGLTLARSRKWRRRAEALRKAES
jgi:heme exporter protein D